MKLFYAALIGFLCLAFPVSAGNADLDYWVCMQSGTMEKAPAYVVSNIFVTDLDSYEKTERLFEKVAVKHSEGKFQPEFRAVCRNFQTEKKAAKYLKKNIELANLRKFMILWVDFAREQN